MHDELTAVDIKKMDQEVEYRRLQLRPQLLEDVKTAREFGDLSENFEYKAAKQEKNHNERRIRHEYSRPRTVQKHHDASELRRCIRNGHYIVSSDFRRDALQFARQKERELLI